MPRGYVIEGEGVKEEVATLDQLTKRVREITGRVPDWMVDLDPDEYIGVEEEWQVGEEWKCLYLEGSELPTEYERGLTAMTEGLPAAGEVAGMVKEHTGLVLVEWPGRTSSLVLDLNPSRGHASVLFGPYVSQGDNDVRILVQYRTLDGTRTLDLLVQDKDDDAFLNINAAGVERYDVGIIWLDRDEHDEQ